MEIKEDVYAKELLKIIDRLKTGLTYYIDRTHKLENELDYYKDDYENRVDEFLNRDRFE